MMRIITGSAKGRRLVTLEGDSTRPTSERIKGAIFSSIQFECEGRVVLDLFAGSGQLGIEALSRGAAHAVFVDNSTRSLRCINENLRNTKLTRLGEVINRDSYDYIRLTAQTFDIIFLDPPYRYGHIHKLLPLAAAKLRQGGSIICEYEKDSEDISAPEGMTLKKVYTYGKINVAVFRKPSEEDE